MHISYIKMFLVFPFEGRVPLLPRGSWLLFYNVQSQMLPAGDTPDPHACCAGPGAMARAGGGGEARKGLRLPTKGSPCPLHCSKAWGTGVVSGMRWHSGILEHSVAAGQSQLLVSHPPPLVRFWWWAFLPTPTLSQLRGLCMCCLTGWHLVFFLCLSDHLQLLTGIWLGRRRTPLGLLATSSSSKDEGGEVKHKGMASLHCLQGRGIAE